MNIVDLYERAIIRLKKIFLKKVIINGNVYWSYFGRYYPDYLNKGNAKSFIEDRALKYCEGYGIDVGAGNWALKGAIPIDNDKDLNAFNLNAFKDESLDYVFSSHCLEHLDDWQKALLLWIKKIKKHGILFLYLPHPSMLLWRPLSPWVGKNHKHILYPSKILGFLSDNQMEIIEYASDADLYWSYYIAGRKK